ncbi:MAG: HAD-IA family hydrolase [Propionibacteriaceae bacterium]|nr:HAD-IA family hydrolase [Propionibacteriaceae bacterium]
MNGQAVVLDAMGVIFESADDVAGLLIPYLRKLGCTLADSSIEKEYRRCSLGEFASNEFWEKCGVAGNDEEYCLLHELMPGMPELLDEFHAAGIPVAVLSNDVSQWSRILRRRFRLDDRVRHWVVSADVGVRKPDAAIYRSFLKSTGWVASQITFFDDRPANVMAARAAGMRSQLFTDVDEIRRVLGIKD